MNISRNQIVVLIFTVALSSAGSVLAASLFKGGDVIWKAGNNVYFKYVDQDKTGFGKNDHPVELTASEISTVLASLKIQEKGPSCCARKTTNFVLGTTNETVG